MLLLHYVFRISKSCPLVVDFLRAISLGLRPALSFLGLAGPRPEAPQGLESQPRPAPPPETSGPRLGLPEADPRPGHPTLCTAHTFFSPGKLIKKSELVLA